MFLDKNAFSLNDDDIDYVFKRYSDYFDWRTKLLFLEKVDINILLEKQDVVLTYINRVMSKNMPKLVPEFKDMLERRLRENK